MELQHTFTVPAPVDRAWSTLLDVEGIAPCFPGAALTGVEGDSFSGTVKVKLGPVSLQYAGKGRFVERDEAAHRVVLEANGSDKRGNGTAGATVQARLEPAGDAETRVVVDTDLKVTGRPAQFGRGVLQDVGGRIIEQFATCLASRMGAPSEPVGESTPSETAPSETAPTETAPSETEEPTAAAAASARAAAPAASVPSPGPSPTPSPSRPTGPRAPTPAPRTPEPAAELDLNRVVLPALARRYGPGVLAGLLALIVVRLLVRRRR